MDGQGNLWGTWLQSYGVGFNTPPRTSLFRYNPDRGETTWYKVSLPALYPGDVAYVDSALNGGDGYIYLGTTAGALLRLDPSVSGSEIPGLAPDGLAPAWSYRGQG